MDAMRAFSIAEDALRKHLKGTRLEAPARAVVEWRRPTWRQDRLDNNRPRLLIDYTFREDSCGRNANLRRERRWPVHGERIRVASPDGVDFRDSLKKFICFNGRRDQCNHAQRARATGRSTAKIGYTFPGTQSTRFSIEGYKNVELPSFTARFGRGR